MISDILIIFIVVKKRIRMSTHSRLRCGRSDLLDLRARLMELSRMGVNSRCRECMGRLGRGDRQQGYEIIALKLRDTKIAGSGWIGQGALHAGNLQSERKGHGSITNHVPRFSFLVRFLQSLRASACCIGTVHSVEIFLATVFSHPTFCHCAHHQGN